MIGEEEYVMYEAGYAFVQKCRKNGHVSVAQYQRVWCKYCNSTMSGELTGAEAEKAVNG